MSQQKTGFKSFLPLLVLIIAGETIFFLPFVIARVFRPTLLEVFQIDNFELGLLFSFYGVVAMASYVLGGPLADRFASRKLMSIALFITGIGGLVMAQVPDFESMKYLYAFWGMSTILLFWSAMIKATRLWGGDGFQGRAFGWLEGGRGLVAAGSGSALVFIFSYTHDSSLASSTEEAFQYVIYTVSGFTIASSLLIWWAVRENSSKQSERKSFEWEKALVTLKLPTVWLLSVIIVCAYCGYKITDDFSLLAKDILKFDDVNAAHVGTLSLWSRVIVAILAGILADKILTIKVVKGSFMFMFVGSLLIGSTHLIFNESVITSGTLLVTTVITSLLITSIGVFALRALYFALLDEGNIPLALTGTATGIISFIGYTPDVFMGPTMGYLLDQTPGIGGHRDVFLMLAGISLVGWLAGWRFQKISKR